MKEELIEAIHSELVSTANFLRGMALDPSLPQHAKEAVRSKVEEIDEVTDRVELEAP